MKKIYLDNAATTTTDREVLLEMQKYSGKEYTNPSSIHTSGRKAAEVISQCKATIAQYIGALPTEVIFTGSGTESDNLSIMGFARANREYGKHIIVSSVEHKAVLKSAELLREEGFEISFAPVDSFGLVRLEQVLSLVREDTILISIMLANNEIGTIQPIKELAEKLKKKKK